MRAGSSSRPRYLVQTPNTSTMLASSQIEMELICDDHGQVRSGSNPEGPKRLVGFRTSPEADMPGTKTGDGSLAHCVPGDRQSARTITVKSADWLRPTVRTVFLPPLLRRRANHL